MLLKGNRIHNVEPKSLKILSITITWNQNKTKDHLLHDVTWKIMTSSLYLMSVIQPPSFNLSISKMPSLRRFSTSSLHFPS